MAIQSRRYFMKGPDIAEIQAETDPGAALTAAPYSASIECTWDDTIADMPAMDAAMLKFGYIPAAAPAAGTTYFALISPDGSTWELTVDNVGAISASKLV